MRGAIYNTYPYTLAAGEKVEIHRRFSFVTCLEATGEFEIAMTGEDFSEGDFGDFAAGLSYQAPADEIMTGLTVRNTSGAVNTIKLAIGLGNVTDARLNITGAISAEPQAPDIWTASAVQTVGAGAVASVLAANGNRREAIITNNGGAAVWLRPTSGTSIEGMRLASNDTVFLEYSGEIFAYNPSGSGVDIVASETEWS